MKYFFTFLFLVFAPNAFGVTDAEVRDKLSFYRLEVDVYKARKVHPAYALAKILMGSENAHDHDIAWAVISEGKGFGGLDPLKVASPEEAALGKVTAFLYGVAKGTKPIALNKTYFPEHAAILGEFLHLGQTHIVDDIDLDVPDEPDELSPKTDTRTREEIIAQKPAFTLGFNEDVVEAFSVVQSLYGNRWDILPQQFAENEILRTLGAIYFGNEINYRGGYFADALGSINKAWHEYSVDPETYLLESGYYYFINRDGYPHGPKAYSFDPEEKNFLKAKRNIAKRFIAGMVQGFYFGGDLNYARAVACLGVLSKPRDFSPEVVSEAERNIKFIKPLFTDPEFLGSYIKEFNLFLSRYPTHEQLNILEKLINTLCDVGALPNMRRLNEDLVIKAYCELIIKTLSLEPKALRDPPFLKQFKALENKIGQFLSQIYSNSHKEFEGKLIRAILANVAKALPARETIVMGDKPHPFSELFQYLKKK